MVPSRPRMRYTPGWAGRWSTTSWSFLRASSRFDTGGVSESKDAIRCRSQKVCKGEEATSHAMYANRQSPSIGRPFPIRVRVGAYRKGQPAELSLWLLPVGTIEKERGQGELCRAVTRRPMPKAHCPLSRSQKFRQHLPRNQEVVPMEPSVHTSNRRPEARFQPQICSGTVHHFPFLLIR